MTRIDRVRKCPRTHGRFIPGAWALALLLLTGCAQGTPAAADAGVIDAGVQVDEDSCEQDDEGTYYCEGWSAPSPEFKAQVPLLNDLSSFEGITPLESVDNSAGFHGRIANQYYVGDCTSFATAAAFELAETGLTGLPPDTADLSEWYLWSCLQNRQQSVAAAVDGALAGIIPETVMPYPEEAMDLFVDKSVPMGPGCVPGAARYDRITAMDKAGKSPQIVRLVQSDWTDGETLKRILSRGPGASIIVAVKSLLVRVPGSPADLRISVFKAAPKFNGFIDPPAEDYAKPRYRRGHAVLLVGYKTIGGRLFFKFRNSWGPGWNKQNEAGYGYLAFDYLKAFCAEAYAVTGVVHLPPCDDCR